MRSTTPLPLAAGTIVLRGLVGAYDLAYDDRRRLYISDPQHGGIRRTLAPHRLDIEETEEREGRGRGGTENAEEESLSS